MERQELRELLEKLDSEIQHLESTSDAALETVRRLRGEIGALLPKPEEADADAHRTLLDSLRKIREDFQKSHPQLTMLIEHITDRLSNMGI